MGKILKKTREYLEKNNLKIPVIVEVRNQFEIDTVRNFPWVKRILFDNIEPEELIRKVEFVSDDFETEASGMINQKNIINYAETGVDFISIGALTNSIKNIDLSMKAI
tara:strand:- start:230 stop:553 length:324 start_codon:yes stop_codon:yes gene_type:complete